MQPGAVRVATHVAELGGQAGGPILEVAGTTRQVTVDLEATRQGMVAVGQTVDVELPDGTVVAGTVASVGTVAETPEGSEGDPTADTTPTIEVTVSLDDPAAAGALDQAPVTVSVVPAPLRASPLSRSTPCWPSPRAATPSSARWRAAAPSWSRSRSGPSPTAGYR